MRRDAQALSDQGVAVARGHLLSRLAALIETAPTLPEAQRFARHLQTEWTALFAFLWAPDIDATNWRPEQAIRPAVVTRKICGGNRTSLGAETQEILAGVVQTARQRKLDLTETITTLFRTPALSPLAAFERRSQ